MPPFPSGPQPKQIGDDFCGLVLNQPLGGLRVIEGQPLYEDRTEGMGAVAAYTYGEHTVVFVGTRSGQLKKVGGKNGWLVYRGGKAVVNMFALLFELGTLWERKEVREGN